MLALYVWLLFMGISFSLCTILDFFIRRENDNMFKTLFGIAFIAFIAFVSIFGIGTVSNILENSANATISKMLGESKAIELKYEGLIDKIKGKYVVLQLRKRKVERLDSPNKEQVLDKLNDALTKVENTLNKLTSNYQKTLAIIETLQSERTILETQKFLAGVDGQESSDMVTDLQESIDKLEVELDVLRKFE